MGMQVSSIPVRSNPPDAPIPTCFICAHLTAAMTGGDTSNVPLLLQ